MNALALVLLASYFVPAIIANTRKHNATFAIFMLNLLLGWTFIGWALALVWACTNDVNKEPRRLELRDWVRQTLPMNEKPQDADKARCGHDEAVARFLGH
jgi:hypothetical protein